MGPLIVCIPHPFLFLYLMFSNSICEFASVIYYIIKMLDCLEQNTLFIYSIVVANVKMYPLHHNHQSYNTYVIIEFDSYKHTLYIQVIGHKDMR